MCLEFHPTKPSILAGGSFNGNINGLGIPLKVKF